MKKRLFKGVSILGAVLLLANVVLPGLQVYASTEAEPSDDWEINDWKTYHGSYSYGSYTATLNADGDTLTFSDVKLQNLGITGIPGKGSDVVTGGLVGVLYFAPADGEGDGATLMFNGDSWNDRVSEGVGSQTAGDPRYSVGDRYWVTPENVAEALNNGQDKLTRNFKVEGSNTEKNYVVEIEIDNLTLYNGTDENDVDFKVENGTITVLNGKSTAWELGCWTKPGESACSSDYGTYSVAYSDNNQTITFSNIELQYPGDDGVTRPDSSAAYFGVKIIAPEADTSDISKITIGTNDYTMNDAKDGAEDDGRYFVYYWPHVTAADVETALADTNGIITETVIGTLDGTETTLTINIDVNTASFSSGDEVDIKTEGGKIKVKDGEEVKQKSSGSSSGGGGGRASASNSNDSQSTTADDTKATADEDATADEANAEETNAEEDNEENANEEKPVMTEEQAVEKFGQEQIDAYKWALENGITTMKTVGEARLDEPLTRAELAKMMVVYIQKVLEKEPVVTEDVTYKDVDESLGDLAGYIKLAYQYQIMGINADGTPIEFFNPHGLVTRGEYATVFSRVLFGDKFNKDGADFYTKHLEALKTAGILTNTIPTIQEMRGWVMLMMYRSSQNSEAIENVANTSEGNEDGAKADEETTTDETASESATNEESVNEEPKTDENTEASTENTEENTNEETSTAENAEETPSADAESAEAATGDVAETPAEEANS